MDGQRGSGRRGLFVGSIGRLVGAGLAAAAFLVGALGGAKAEDRSLSFYYTHTKETLTVVYKRDGRYDRSGLAKLNKFLRDWRRGEPTKMDPELFDILWEVYRETGATQPIHIISAYRSPETNKMLRSRSNGVAKSSLHMKGQAMDFFIPGVPISKLRAIGLRLQAGGVGYYPSSNFVHLDTGSVRHWPRMTRKQLVAIFPKGGTLHVPSDGKPLPGYAQALAAYKLRKARGAIGAPLGDDDDAPVVVAAAEMPLPRVAPPRSVPTPEPADRSLVADAAGTGAPVGLLTYAGIDRVIATAMPLDADRIRAARPDFGSHDLATPQVPGALAAAMAERDHSTEPSTPIPPTSVVATVDVVRPLRAEAMTTAVMRGGAAGTAAPPVLAFAGPAAGNGKPVVAQASLGGGIRLPQLNPQRAAPVEAVPETPAATSHRVSGSKLTLTALDTHGLEMLILSEPARDQRPVLVTMRDGLGGLVEASDPAFLSPFRPASSGSMDAGEFADPASKASAIELLRQKLIALSAQ